MPGLPHVRLAAPPFFSGGRISGGCDVPPKRTRGTAPRALAASKSRGRQRPKSDETLVRRAVWEPVRSDPATPPEELYRRLVQDARRAYWDRRFADLILGYAAAFKAFDELGDDYGEWDNYREWDLKDLKDEFDAFCLELGTGGEIIFVPDENGGPALLVPELLSTQLLPTPAAEASQSNKVGAPERDLLGQFFYLFRGILDRGVLPRDPDEVVTLLADIARRRGIKPYRRGTLERTRTLQRFVRIVMNGED
jgi:hypothetical protein